MPATIANKTNPEAQYNMFFHQAVENFCYVDGNPFKFKNRDHLKPIYNTGHNFVLLKSARKTEKSTFLCNKIALLSCLHKNFKSMYVAPRDKQVGDFSNSKFKIVVRESPSIANMQDASCFDNVSYKTFLNNSLIYFRPCWLSADGLRGPAAELLAIDEIQDIIYDNVPVALEVLSGDSPDEPGRPKKLKLFTGTPKTFDNTIEHYWSLSTQNEWLVKCEACKKWNFLDTKSIGAKGIICSKCKKSIDARNGRWVSHNPDANILGFRLTQLMLSWTDWPELLVKYETYPEGKFLNEVVGISHDVGEKPVSMEEIRECCSILSPPKPMALKREKYMGNMPLFMGVDWGTGEEDASFTVVTIGGYIKPGIMSVFYAKKYKGRGSTDPEFLIQDIARLKKEFGVTLIAPDWGFGFFMNKLLRKKVESRIIAEVYCHGTTRDKLKWDMKTQKFIANRNDWYADTLLDVKETKFSFFKWEEFKPFADDIYNIHQAHNNRGQVYFDRNPSKPIDFLSALVNLKIAASIFYGHNHHKIR